ncbi:MULTISPECIES: NADH-quinone oxidoreductase subunit NuoN [unclassified Devosia]|jgi:NADH-quinone oxidoreductase subunit N|uniref:NADH-quinone oxidoreductase subunit NuoN n=1 Tax=unclassified Devosia TaxID=196773 RepID=UPI000869AEB2|nr:MULTISPECIES: NADH-quinone oxidoreductase subunit NuoN [unclassified Devosia]MBN9361625.1 NADH-quinone oxidoreductase subunit NuoN [Devosia sp.]ODS94968.1 MAG: NADH-quinone oxidoreductase subunit N [Devosia sp. SCN 66-27]OJX26672.1 MAG: NADH-quinone oxidoreductase subunit N [Devosia sp. 66-14]
MLSDVTSFASLAPAYPELLLAVGAIVVLLVSLFWKGISSKAVSIVAIVLLLVVLAVLLLQPAAGVLFNGVFIVDGFARYMKALVLGGAAATLLISLPNSKEHGIDKFEYAVLVLLATLGMMIMVSANDLMSLYIGLELQSLALYVVAAMKREDRKATEAGIKYFVLGALSSGMLLYGASLVYGFTGTTQIDQIVTAISLDSRSIGLIFGMVFLLAGIAFKISAVPFHMWTPDVYEGAPTPVTAFFAAAPKVAAMALFIRVTTVSFAPITHDWQQIVIFLSIASMVLAAFAAIGQNNLKRLLAYSSIGHVGFALVGLSSGTEAGVEGVAVYMAIYIAMTVGIFACVLALRTENGPVETISELAGLAQKRPFVAAIIAILMFSLIGLPPLAGFFAKWQVFLAAVEQNLFVLAVIGVLASAVSAFYYLRIVKVMYFDEPVAKFAAVPGELNVVMAGIGFLIVTYFVTVGSPLTAAAHSAAGSLF